jgi:tetratricopeptide (TPR) repeat protein
MWIIRYPRSGRKFFIKALSINSANADAYMQLGLIALRRFQKKKAYAYFEKAYALAEDRIIEKKLRRIYQKEFINLFNKK